VIDVWAVLPVSPFIYLGVTMRIAIKALAATALLSLAAHASATPDTSVRYFSEDVFDTEPGKDRWVFHYTVSAGEGLTLGSLFDVRFDDRYFNNLSIDVLDNPAVAGSVRQPNAAEKLPGFAILEPSTEVRYKDLIFFDVAFDRVSADLPMSQPFDVSVLDGER
jgi:hypothetical protein